MTQLRDHEADLAALDIDVMVVTFDSLVMAQGYVQETGLTWPLVVDSERLLYRAYRMDRIGWWSIYGPGSVWHYLKLIFGKGRRIPKPGSDLHQIGGDVLIDPDGTVQFHYVSDSPHDRPSVATILEVRRRAETP